MKIAVLSVTKHGATLGQKLKAYYEGFKDSDVSLVCYEKEGRQSDAADAVIHGYGYNGAYDCALCAT